MSKKNYSNHIDGVEALRESVRKIVSERVYAMLNESVFEGEEDDKKSNWDKTEDDYKKSQAKGKGSNRAREWKPQIVKACENDLINQAAVAYAVHPNMSKDAARSEFSKQVRGERPFEGDDVITAHQVIANQSSEVNEDESNSRMLTNEEKNSLYEKLCSRKNH